jgi:uncharacterized membrane protein
MTGIEKLPNRIVWADAARVLALLLMVQGHTIDVLLSSALREGHLHDLWLYCRGLTAPTFMFLSGFSFAIASLKRWDSYLIPSPALRKRVTRFLFLIALGYAMHLPVRSVHDFGHVDQGAWHAWLQIDVLQCIGVALLILQTLVFIARDQKRFAIVAACLSALIVLATPFLSLGGLRARRSKRRLRLFTIEIHGCCPAYRSHRPGDDEPRNFLQQGTVHRLQWNRILAYKSQPVSDSRRMRVRVDFDCCVYY